MPKCKQCGDVFGRWQTFNDRKIDCRRRIYCLKCHPKTGKIGKYDTNGERCPKVKRICNVCGKEYLQKTRNNTCSTCKHKNLKEINKNKMYEIMGCKCWECGYDRCKEALDLHHIDPQIKKFNLSAHWGSKIWIDLEDEVKKCALVCSNCHDEIHAGLIKCPSKPKEI